MLFGLFGLLSSLVHPSQYCVLVDPLLLELLMSEDTILGYLLLSVYARSLVLTFSLLALSTTADDPQLHVLAHTSPLNSLLDPTAYSTCLSHLRCYNSVLLWVQAKTSEVPYRPPPNSLAHPIPSKSCKLYLQNASKIQLFLTVSIITTLVCPIISCHFSKKKYFIYF